MSKKTNIIDLIGSTDSVDYEFMTIRGSFIKREEIDNILASAQLESREAAKAAVMEEAQRVFGDATAAERWLNTYNHALQATPLQAIDAGNLGDVRRVLNAISYGGVV
jgi:uncharacterized protein (DUF2384 family)